MKQRAQHIARVLAVAPLLYLIEAFLRALNGGQGPKESFGGFVWDLMWEDINDTDPEPERAS